jgi:glycosyltransferase involved in cell wall biosynthesis
MVQEQKNIKFILLGNGPEKEKLTALKSDFGLENILFLNSVSKDEMPFVLAAVNAAVIPLRKLDLFKGAIPSKIFESLSMELPILLGVDGEARKLFIDEAKSGLYFEPENPTSMKEQVLQLANDSALRSSLGKNGRNYVSEYFNRDKIASNFYNRLKQIDDK